MNPPVLPIAEAMFGPGARGWTPAVPLPPEGHPRTALPVQAGRPRHLAAHGQRLEAGAAALGFPVPWLREALGGLSAWLGEHVEGDLALRLALHPEEALLKARLEPWPAPPEPCRLVPLPHPMGDLRSSPLARHKGLSGSWWVQALAGAQAQGGFDALLYWPDGTVAETAIATVALEAEGTLFLPPEAGRVASVTERLDLPTWAQHRGLELRYAPFTPEARGRFWCLNALRGIWLATIL